MKKPRLEFPPLPPEEKRGAVPRHLLALTGGGYRGLFSAEIIAALERPGIKFASHFDMIAGTSIGGIIAIGLACGVTGATLAALIRDRGSAIFKSKLTSIGGFTAARYASDGLEAAVVTAIGKSHANRYFSDIPVPLVVCAVDELGSRPRIFRTDLASGGNGDKVRTLDVALATSAAPTYFQPHFIQDRNFVDGGLIANAPDLVVLTEAIRRFGCSYSDCHLLSVGTANSPRQGRASGSPGKIGWIAKHKIIDLIMTAQEELAISQVRALAPATFLRLDMTPSRKIELDEVSEGATSLLISLAGKCLEDLSSGDRQTMQMFKANVAEHAR